MKVIIKEKKSVPRLFHLNRKKDVNGISGTGIVAEGVVFSDGKVAMRWLSETASTIIYDSIEHVKNIHGHEGASEIVFLD